MHKRGRNVNILKLSCKGHWGVHAIDFFYYVDFTDQRGGEILYSSAGFSSSLTSSSLSNTSFTNALGFPSIQAWRATNGFTQSEPYKEKTEKFKSGNQIVCYQCFLTIFKDWLTLSKIQKQEANTFFLLHVWNEINNKIISSKFKITSLRTCPLNEKFKISPLHLINN